MRESLRRVVMKIWPNQGASLYSINPNRINCKDDNQPDTAPPSTRCDTEMCPVEDGLLLELCDLEGPIQERDYAIGHVTVQRRVFDNAPCIEKMFHKMKR